VYIDLREKSYSGIIDEGVYDDRFELVLRKTRRNANANASAKSGNEVLAINNKLSETVTIYSKVEEETINKIELFNILGQNIMNLSYSGTSNQEVISSNTLSIGTYIVRTTTNGHYKWRNLQYKNFNRKVVVVLFSKLSCKSGELNLLLLAIFHILYRVVTSSNFCFSS